MSANGKIEVRFTEAPEKNNETYTLLCGGYTYNYKSIVAAVHTGVASKKEFTVYVSSGAAAVLGVRV